MRTHYADRASAALALRGLEHFEAFEEIYGGPAGFVRTGFAYVADSESGPEVAERVAMLRSVGVETELVDDLGPAVVLGEGEVAAWEERSGYANPAQTTSTLVAAARAAGAVLCSDAPVAELGADEVTFVDGTRASAGAVVLCAGAWSKPLAAPLGLDLPLCPTAVKLAIFSRNVDAHPTVIDAVNGVYFRSDGAAGTLVGRMSWRDEPLASPDSQLPAVDDAFVDGTRVRLAARLPSAAGAELVGSRAGMMDMTPDGLPLVGPSEVDGLWLCCGWSGTGFKTGPSVGEALAAWIAGGEAPAALEPLSPAREMREAAGVRSPH